MKRPHFKACNNGCRARKPVGMATNGGCRFPHDLTGLRSQAGLLWGSHGDPGVRKFARTICDLLDHIVELDE